MTNELAELEQHAGASAAVSTRELEHKRLMRAIAVLCPSSWRLEWSYNPSRVRWEGSARWMNEEDTARGCIVYTAPTAPLLVLELLSSIVEQDHVFQGKWVLDA